MLDASATPRVLIIGGGLSGLAAAHRLTLTRLRVTLVEKSPNLGGKVLTENIDGFLVEAGPDSFVAPKGSVIELATELGIADQIISSRPEHRGSFVWSRGRLHPLPEGLLLMAPSRVGPLMLSSLLSWKGKLRVLGDLVIPRRPGDEDESLESFVVRRLGREVLDRIAQPLIAGVHAAEPATMSLRASFPRFLDMEREHRSLILAARAAARSAAALGSSHFASFRHGMGELTSGLASSLKETDVRSGVSVTRLRSNGGGYLVDLSDGSQLEAEAVIMATPACESTKLLSEVAPLAAAAIAEIRQVSTTAITLGYRSDRIPPLHGSGFVVPAIERRQIMGVSYSSQKWQGRVPNQEFSLLRVFVSRQHAVADQERLRDMVMKELRDLIGVVGPAALSRVHSWAGGLHQYTLRHLERVARAEDALDALPPLELAGAGFHGIGLNECIVSGRKAADRVASSVGTHAQSAVSN